MSAERAFEHYATQSARFADQCIHVLGLAIATIGAAVAIALAVLLGGGARVGAVIIYAVCLLAMLSVSAAYNLATSASMQRRLRRFDHALIFLMIAGSYTPFTTQRLDGALALIMTAAVWIIAAIAAAGKLCLPGVSKQWWLIVYVALGWLVVFAAGPLSASLPSTAMILLVCGGVIYTAGIAIYAADKLIYRRAIWHGFVIIAASTHYAAVVTGVILA